MKSRTRTVPGAVVAILALACTCERVAGQVPYLLRDVNPAAVGSFPRGIVEFNGIGYFEARGRDTGNELWRSDGTASGTWLVADIFPGGTGSAPRYLGVAGGRLYFVAREQATGNELWTSDGTTTGTRMVKELVPGFPGVSRISPLVELGGIAYFTLILDDGAAALYRSDGTAGGTYQVQEICRSCWEAIPPVLVGGRLVFRGFDVDHGWEPWISDGTAAGTALLSDIFPGLVGSLTQSSGSVFTVRGGTAFFLADDGVRGRELWLTDGTAGGTRLVAEMAPGPAAPPFNWTTPQIVLGNDILFQIDDGTGSCPLWKSDGTAPGTIPLSPLNSGLGCGTVVGAWIASGGLAYFQVTPDFADIELWRSDGTAAGTYPLGVLLASNGTEFATLGGAVYFAGLDPATGEDLWATDGSVAGTERRFDFPPGGNRSGLWELARVGGKLLLSATESEGFELWQSDGSAGGTAVVTRMNAGSTVSSSVQWPSTVPGGLCFGGSGGQLGNELWCTDGTVPGTRRIDLPCDVAAGCFLGLESAGNWLMVQIDDGSGRAFEPWRVDPTGVAPPPPAPLGDLCPGSCASEPLLLSRGGPVALMSADVDDLTSGLTLWRTDGTLPGTRQVGDARPAGFHLAVRQSAGLDGIVYFAANQQDSGLELWRSDGTGPGTFEVKDIHAGIDSSSPDGFVVLGDRLYFAAADDSHGRELWSSGGTGPDTRLELLDLCPGVCGGEPAGLMRSGDSLYFTAYDGVAARFFRSDGTVSGTVALAVVNPDGPTDFPTMPVAANGLVFFVVRKPVATILELWRTDGTPAGTLRVPGLPLVTLLASYPGMLAAAAGQVWLFADDGVHGAELWHSDGQTSALVADLWPGISGSMPFNVSPWVQATDRHLVFLADDGVTGEEPWALELPSGRTLLRNDAVRSLAPVVPPLAGLLPLDPARDRYRDHVVTGEVDPEDRVLRDAVRPLVFYSLDGAGTIRLAKSAIGQVRIWF